MILDKLTVVNNALSATGNKAVLSEGDNSDEWAAGSAAFDRMLPVVMAKHNWKFQTAIADLARVGTSNFPGYGDMYAKPGDCLHIENVWDSYLASLIQPATFPVGMSRDGIRAPPMEYRVIGDLIHCTAPLGATALYVKNALPDTPAAVLFIEALTTEVEALILRGLNEDNDAAKLVKVLAGQQTQEAKYKTDAEEPRAKPFRSGMLEKRRGRRFGWWGVSG